MPNGPFIQVRVLPDGPVHTGRLRSSRGRVLELELADSGAQCDPGSPAELDDEEAIYLGMIERRNDNRIWVGVEHRLDRKPLEALRAAWREGG